MNSLDPLEEFQARDYAKAYEIVNALYDRRLIAEEHRNALYHALIDITNSIGAIYSAIIPRLLVSLNADEEELRDVLFELRDEFRHIEYHIRDARLADWEWPDLEKDGDQADGDRG